MNGKQKWLKSWATAFLIGFAAGPTSRRRLQRFDCGAPWESMTELENEIALAQGRVWRLYGPDFAGFSRKNPAFVSPVSTSTLKMPSWLVISRVEG